MDRSTKSRLRRRKKSSRSKKQKKELDMNASECEYCGDVVVLPFKCNFCGSKFCSKHRLPENHSCHFQPARTPLGQWKAKYENLSSEPSVPLISRRVNKHSSKPLMTAAYITAALGMLMIMAIVVPVLALMTQNPAIVLLILLGFIFVVFWILATGISNAKEH